MAFSWLQSLGRVGRNVTALVGLILLVWLLRQTQGGLISELFFQLTRPLHPGPAPTRVNPAQLVALQQQLVELQAENRLLRRQLKLAAKAPPTQVLAPITARSPDAWWQQLTLGVGSLSGVSFGDPVLGNGALVGRVVALTPSTSRVLLITDPSSGAGVMVSRTRAQGYIRGSGTSQVTLRFFDKDPQVKVGDTVVTAPASTLFPPGLPVGVVQRLDRRAGPVPEAVIALTARPAELEWLSVQRRPAAQPVRP